MKTRKVISMLVVSLPLVSGSLACGSGSQTDEPTAQTSQEQVIGAAGNIIAWPVGPVTWNGLVGTWPIAVWSPTTIGTLAFGINGMVGLGATAVGFPGIVAAPITTGVLNGFIPPVAAAPVGAATPFLGASGLIAPAFGFTGAFNPWVGGAGWGFGLNAFAPVGGFSTTFANGAFTPGLNWWTPMLTSSALMFSNLAAINTFTPFTFNLTFHAASAAQVATFAQTASLASLSIFASPILPGAFIGATTAIPFMSIAFPVMPMPFVGLGAAVAPVGVGVGAAGVGVGVGAAGVGVGAAGLGVGVGAGLGAAVAPVGLGVGAVAAPVAAAPLL
ncbi:MAG TPA: hypothetical protein VF765_18925 [Polyangiaceae bacterium]